MYDNKVNNDSYTNYSFLPDISCIDGQFIDLLMTVTKAIRQNPQQSQLYISRANIFLKYEQYFYALQDANEVIRLVSKSVIGYVLKGNIYMDMEMYSEAMAVFQEGLIRCRHSSRYFLEKKLTEAKSLYDEQLDVESKIPSYGLWLGFLIGLLTSICIKFVNVNAYESNSLRIVLFLTPVIIFYMFALFYNHLIQQERRELLLVPNYFFEADQLSPESTLISLYKKRNYNK